MVRYFTIGVFPINYIMQWSLTMLLSLTLP